MTNALDEHKRMSGDIGHAVRTGTTTGTSDTPIGRPLESPAARPDEAITSQTSLASAHSTPPSPRRSYAN
ncbi:hypothetical protein [Kitasatospora sp. HPMI-4]|uniref:hypothetical protein n=1 Tax=Kitasatospora sp. HPMI-4 TaxID=3448443 RepID=UPI003F1B124A